MVSIIKTAIITIVISFISGLLLEYYKNLAPKILCKIGNAIPMETNNKKVCEYIVVVRNISNKIIHELTLNIQSSQNNLKISDAKITKGLKFDSLIKDGILDVYIPFLSKDDEFSVKLYVENQYGRHNKPIIIIRSPENFKEVDSVEQGILSSLFNMPRNINTKGSNIMRKNERIAPNEKDDFTMVMDKLPGAKRTTKNEMFHRNKKPSKSKKAMLIIISIILVMFVGVLGKFYFKDNTTSVQTPSVKQSTDTTGSSDGKTKNSGVKVSKDGTTKNKGVKTPTGGTTENTEPKASTGETTKNTDTKTSTGGTTENADTKTSTGGTTGNADTKTPADGTTKNTNTKTSTGETTGNTDAKASTEGTTKNTDTKASTGGTTGNTDTKTQTSGSTGNTGN